MLYYIRMANGIHGRKKYKIKKKTRREWNAISIVHQYGTGQQITQSSFEKRAENAIVIESAI